MSTQQIIESWENGVEPYKLPKQFSIGTKVRGIYNGEVNTVSRTYWQWYAGGNTADYTVEFAEGGWNKSTNLIAISSA